MATPAELDAQFLAARRERFIEYLNDGLTAKEIAAREGLQPDYALKERARIASEENLEVKETSSSEKIYGLTDKTKDLRAKLGNVLYRMRNEGKLPPKEVARITGIPVKHQKRASDRPYSYDWTLTQMERTIAWTNVEFETFIFTPIFKLSQMY